MFVQSLSRLTPRVVKEKWPLKNRMLSRKCRLSASALDHSLISSGIGVGSASSICPFRQQKPGVSCSNFLAWQCSQLGTCSNICVSGRFEYTKSKGSIPPSSDKSIDVSRSTPAWSKPTQRGCHINMFVTNMVDGKMESLAYVPPRPYVSHSSSMRSLTMVCSSKIAPRKASMSPTTFSS